MSTRHVTTCDLCGSEAVEPAVRFLADVDICKACAERPIIDLGPLFADLAALARRDRLSPREREVLRLMADGLSIPAIAARIYVSESTAKTYAFRLYRKLGAENRAQALIAAARSGII